MSGAHSVKRAARFVGDAVLEIDRWVRIHFIGFSTLWPILGAASVKPALDRFELIGLLTVACCFHVFGILLNDVVDLPVDRLQPSRAQDPLVRGALRPAHAVVLAVAMIPSAFLAALVFDRSRASLWALAAAFAGMAIYDVWGKKCRIPPITDAIQGAAWASLALWGALAVQQAVSARTVVVGSYAVAYLLLINGIHGGLRDLSGDIASGSRTTAIFLGVRPGQDGRPVVTAAVWVYCLPLQLVLALLTLVPLSWRAPASALAAPGAAAALALCGVNAALMFAVLRPDRPRWQLAFRLHLLTLIVALIVSLAPHSSTSLLLVEAVLIVAPLWILEWTPRVLGWLLSVGKAPTSHESLSSGPVGVEQSRS